MLKFLFDIAMVTLFISLVLYFSRQRKQRKLQARLTAIAQSRLQRESLVTSVFVVFYIVRIIVMDLGYSILVIKYFTDANSGQEWNPDDIIFGEKSYIFIALYSLDFLICMALLFLFHIYSRKSTEDEERLRNCFLMSLRGENEFNVNNSESVGLAHKDLENDSFIHAQKVEQNKMSYRDYSQLINNKLLEKTLKKWERQGSKNPNQQSQFL